MCDGDIDGINGERKIGNEKKARGESCCICNNRDTVR